MRPVLMRPHAIRFLTLALYATTTVIAATDANAISRHLRKHHAQMDRGSQMSGGLQNAWASQVRSVAPPQSRGGDACPGSGRSFDCRIWPPPIDDDPDRKATDGGP
jgi:hypothetical protein